MPSLIADTTSPSRPPEAPHVEGPKLKKPMRPAKDLPAFIIDEARATKRVPWDAKQHLTFEPPKSIVTMKDIGLEGHGISPIAVSEPFPLFSKDAMLQMRAEIFSKPVLENNRFSSDLIAEVIRGLTPEKAPFCFSAWYSPEVLNIISKVAGIELVPCTDYEVANVNISINDQSIPLQGTDDQVSSVAWHYDSVPFVCVTMASDCTGMVGGETAIKLPDGDVRKVRGPSQGTAVVMQGRYIYHQALKAFGGRERIAMITSFRAKSPLIRDESVLTGLRAISNVSELYSLYTDYRLEILEERLRVKRKEEIDRRKGQRPYDVAQMRFWLEEQKEFLESMLEQIIDIQ
ncbi:2OG oxygenase superfamily [Fusarium pseudocircinatum]|uniref:2OG oxygenase superfamily n=1 Tax=Fusarium pseudocircinatum TaxID=56676 RepID=A0A8H5PKH1_9HYPO|nr:2OG oxygenase superfamily [Fusarium pseudocircinatum]